MRFFPGCRKRIMFFERMYVCVYEEEVGVFFIRYDVRIPALFTFIRTKIFLLVRIRF